MGRDAARLRICKAIYAHLAAHLKDAQREPPELRAMGDARYPLDDQIELALWRLEDVLHQIDHVRDMRSRKGMTLTEARLGQIEKMNQYFATLCALVKMKQLDRPADAVLEELSAEARADALGRRLEATRTKVAQDTKAQGSRRDCGARPTVGSTHYGPESGMRRRALLMSTRRDGMSPGRLPHDPWWDATHTGDDPMSTRLRELQNELYAKQDGMSRIFDQARRGDGTYDFLEADAFQHLDNQKAALEMIDQLEKELDELQSKVATQEAIEEQDRRLKEKREQRAQVDGGHACTPTGMAMGR